MSYSHKKKNCKRKKMFDYFKFIDKVFLQKMVNKKISKPKWVRFFVG